MNGIRLSFTCWECSNSNKLGCLIGIGASHAVVAEAQVHIDCVSGGVLFEEDVLLIFN